MILKCSRVMALDRDLNAVSGCSVIICLSSPDALATGNARETAMGRQRGEQGRSGCDALASVLRVVNYDRTGYRVLARCPSLGRQTVRGGAVRGATGRHRTYITRSARPYCSFFVCRPSEVFCDVTVVSRSGSLPSRCGRA